MNATYCEAPAGLQAKIHSRLLKESRTVPWQWIAIAASLLLAASVAWNVSMLRSRVAETVLSAHVRSLAGTHLLDVPSSDQHTVKPWFNGKLDFAPPVKSIEGFPLLGGRMEYLDGHAAAALVYGRNRHVINLFVWPAAGASPAETHESRNGYNMERWRANGMIFWAVSDLNPGELRDFESLYRR